LCGTYFGPYVLDRSCSLTKVPAGADFGPLLIKSTRGSDAAWLEQRWKRPGNELTASESTSQQLPTIKLLYEGGGSVME
jgi:hypothetical protein